MYHNLIYWIAGGIGLFAITNIVIRFTVFRMYQQLRDKGVEIGSHHFFNKADLDQLVRKEYPDDEMLIKRFVRYTKIAMTFASILITFILILAFVLFRMR